MVTIVITIVTIVITIVTIVITIVTIVITIATNFPIEITCSSVLGHDLVRNVNFSITINKHNFI